MKKFLRVLGILAIFIVIVGAGITIYLKSAFPKVELPPEMKVDVNPERVARGKYLANHVMVCIDCHSTRDWSKFSGPVVPGTEGKGGELFDESMGFPGTFYSKNITPYGIGNWKDGEIFRAITAGVNKDGEPFFPVMPYPYYSKLDKEDFLSIIAYLRTLAPINYDVPESSPAFPMNLILRTIPENPQFTTRPDKSDIIAYGKYVTSSAACIECHTQADKGKLLEGLEFAGGREFQFPTGEVLRSANITPDDETGIGKWTKEQFIARFKQYDNPESHNITVKPGEFNTVMPWTMYAGMETEDLAAIYEYLRTVKPLSNRVEKFSLQGVK
jgi:mono/diheme cytochrome c family protein